MVLLNLPVVGGDDNTWGEKINSAIEAVNNGVGQLNQDVLAEPVNFYRRYVNGAWEVRGTDFPTHPRTWIRHDNTVPEPPIDNIYFLAGTDIMFNSGSDPVIYDWYKYGAKPALTTLELQTAARSEYDKFLTYTLATDGMPLDMPAGAKRIKVPDQMMHGHTEVGGTVSEGQGYGMLLSAWFGNPNLPAGIHDPNAKANFDALWIYYNYYKTSGGLMHWSIRHDGVIGDTGGATDGDFDIAMALVVAHRTWGSAGTINYALEATAIINAIRDFEFTPATYTGVGGPNVMMNGNQWGVDTDNYMPDYFSPAWMREFKKHTNDSRWDDLIAKNYTMAVQHWHDTYASGMVPDRCTRTFTAITADQFKVTYNSVRQGFRISADYLWNGPFVAPPVSNNILTKALDRHRFIYGAAAAQAKSPPFALDGTGGPTYIDNSGRGLLAPMALLRASDSQYAADMTKAIDADTQASYYNQGVGCMAMAFMAGIAKPTPS